MPSQHAREILDVCGALPDDAVFSSAEGQAFVSLPIGESLRTFPLFDPAVRDWLTERYLDFQGVPPSEAALRGATNLLRARACFRGVHRTVDLRIGQPSRSAPLYIDLANNRGESVEITAAGWNITRSIPPATLRSASDQLSLPRPEPAAARANAADNFSETLLSEPIHQWLLAALRPKGPYPVLILYGPPQSGKTTLARMIASLLDPAAPQLCPLPGRRHPIEKLAYRRRVLAFDHVTRMSGSAADALCQLASGTGIEIREPGEHREPLMLDIARPIILTTPRTGIKDWIPRPDLAARSITVELREITQPRPSQDLDAEFETLRPVILGALYTAVSNEWNSPSYLRLAPADLYDASAAADPVFKAVRAFALDNPAWSGTATDLLNEICVTLSPRALSHRLHLLAKTLALHGTALKFERKHDGVRQITFAPNCIAASPVVAAPPSSPRTNKEFVIPADIPPNIQPPSSIPLKVHRSPCTMDGSCSWRDDANAFPSDHANWGSPARHLLLLRSNHHRIDRWDCE